MGECYKCKWFVTCNIPDARFCHSWTPAKLTDEQSKAERYGYDTDTCYANAAECGGL